jgi:hypothetical protein
MTPFLETMPEHWIINSIAAQGLALHFATKGEFPKEIPDALDIITKAVLYQAWVMQKSGIFSAEDLQTLATNACKDYLPASGSIKGSKYVGESLVLVYSLMEELYQIEADEKRLVSDILQTKSTTH